MKLKAPSECVDCVPRLVGQADCQTCPHCPEWFKTRPARPANVLFYEDADGNSHGHNFGECKAIAWADAPKAQQIEEARP